MAPLWSPLLLLVLVSPSFALPPSGAWQGSHPGRAAPELKKTLDDLKTFTQNTLKFNSEELRHQRLRQASIGPEDTLYLQRDEALCSACDALVGAALAEVALNVSYDVLLQEAIVLCSLGMNSLEYCQGYVPMAGPIVYHMLINDHVRT